MSQNSKKKMTLGSSFTGMFKRLFKKEQLSALEETLRAMERDLEQGGMGLNADEDFHDILARAAGNDALNVMLRNQKDVICIDSIHASSGDYIDIGEPVAGGQVLPVVIKTLIFNS